MKIPLKVHAEFVNVELTADHLSEAEGLKSLAALIWAVIPATSVATFAKEVAGRLGISAVRLETAINAWAEIVAETE